MRRRPLALVVSAAALLTALGGVDAQAAPARPAPTGALHAVHVCPPPTATTATCLSSVLVDDAGRTASPMVAGAPSGYGPADLVSAYGLANTSAGGRTVAIVDAYDDPNAEQDLAVYRSRYGLSACTRANGCFKKVSQTGSASTFPAPNTGWAEEISLDLQMVSAICPSCHLLLVEAKSASLSDLGTAVNYAAAQRGVVAISNSYGSSGDVPDSTAGKYYNHPYIAITASAGDNGYGVSYPASSRYTVAVGGTSLRPASSARGWAETAWSGSGSGCSSINSRPAWQSAAVTGCAGRAEADVSAVADPATGVAVYDSYQTSGWMVFGGTSVSSPIIAAVFALAGHTGRVPYPAQLTWQAPAGSLNDVTAGSNGTCSTPSWCAARPGWDGPTGIGTPRGTVGF